MKAQLEGAAFKDRPISQSSARNEVGLCDYLLAQARRLASSG